MIAQPCKAKPTPRWHAQFLQMLPLIRRIARYSFRHLQGEEHEDAVQEVIANATVAYARLVKQGRAETASGSSLARFAVGQFREGRKTGSRLNVLDISSTYCQQRKGVLVESLHFWDPAEKEWLEQLVEDRTVTPGELAASRIDFSTWLDSLPRRDRKIAEALANGEAASDVAREFSLSSGRISQLRRQLQASWKEFHEPELDAAIA